MIRYNVTVSQFPSRPLPMPKVNEVYATVHGVMSQYAIKVTDHAVDKYMSAGAGPGEAHPRYLSRRRSMLVDSLKNYDLKTRSVLFRAGHQSLSSDYARTHEFGRVIFRKKAKWMRIPAKWLLTRAGVKAATYERWVRKARARQLLFRRLGFSKAVLIDPESMKVVFNLRKVVTIPKRAYLWPAITDYKPWLRMMLMRRIKGRLI